MQQYRARLVVGPNGPETNGLVAVDRGRLCTPDPKKPATDLGDVALVPGLVNAHSHAFQRVIRGRTEWRPPDQPEADFWSWRELMYRAANALGPPQIEAVSRMAFMEMALAGVTTVGEFHYLHHQPDGTPYPKRTEIADRVIAAARSVGLRITLLRVVYLRGGHKTPLAANQRRFGDRDAAQALADVDALTAHWTDDAVRIGVAPHSVRAVDPATLEACAGRGPLHIHACEQRAELAQCQAEHGVGPVELLADTGVLGPQTTLVHATHLAPGDVERLAQTGTHVCACPTTERNLGDGFLPARDLLQAKVPICLGSDSQAEIDLFTEARLVEYHERLRAERRNVLAPPSGQTAQALWPMLSEHGARSLGHDVGALRPGAGADFFTVDLTHPTLLGATADDLLSHLVFAATPAHVRDVFVAGEQLVSAGQHRDQAAICEAYLQAVRSLG